MTDGAPRRVPGRPRRANARRVKVGFKVSAAGRARLVELARINGKKNLAAFIREAVINTASESTDDPELLDL